MDPNNNISIAYVVLKFIQELIPQLMTIIYALNLQDIQIAINIAKKLEGRLSLATQ